MRAVAILIAFLASLIALSTDPVKASFPGPNGWLISHRVGKLVIASPDGSVQREIYPPVPDGSSAFEPAWSPDGRYIAFASTGARGGPGIWILDYVTGGSWKVASPRAGADSYRDPAWSPDGKRLVFEWYRNDRGLTDLAVTDGITGPVTVTSLTESFSPSATDPDWSPDGSKIAFSDSTKIYSMSPSGGNITLLGGLNASASPDWAPDGSSIAFGGVSRINFIVFDENQEPDLRGYDVGHEVWDVSWSPDGNWVAFVGDQGGPSQEELFVVDDPLGPGVHQKQALGVDVDASIDWRPAALADLKVTSFTATPTVKQRDYVELDVAVMNEGPGAARPVLEFDSSAFRLAHVAPSFGDWRCSEPAGVLASCRRSTSLEPGQSASVKLYATAVGSGDSSIDVRAVPLANDPDPTDNGSSASVSIARPDALRSVTVKAQVRLVKGNLIATGSVSPDHPGRGVIVTFFRGASERLSGMSEIGTGYDILSATSTYRSSLKVRPKKLHCAVTVRFPGDSNHEDGIGKSSSVPC